MNETNFLAREVYLKQFGISLLLLTRGDFKMIALQITAVTLGAGMLLSMFVEDIGPELVLAVLTVIS